MKFENTEVYGFKRALKGMRNPLESWRKNDTVEENGKVVIGENDLDLAQRLIKSGSEHRKFMRQIFVSVDITGPLYWWKEFDTYKVGTNLPNSTSTMHKLASTPITAECFEIDDYNSDLDYDGTKLGDVIDKHIEFLESMRVKYLETKDKAYWKELIRCCRQHGRDKNRYNDIRKSFGDVFKRSEKISQIDRMVKVIHRLGENTSVCTGIDIS